MIHRMIFTAIFSFLMSFLMTCWITFINLGLVEDFAVRWMHAFAVAWPSAALIAFFFAPIANRFTTYILTRPKAI